MGTDSEAGAIISFLKNQVLLNSDVEINEDTPLVSSGLVDSFALVDVMLELERVTGRRIPTGRVSPMDLETVRHMLIMAERIGIPNPS